MQIRTATSADRPSVRNVLDGALLAVDRTRLTRALADGDVLVAVPAESETVVGVLVLDERSVVAVAVRRRRRGQGVGTALVRAAADRCGSLRATFDEQVVPFWRSVGFTVEPVDGSDRYRGRYDT